MPSVHDIGRTLAQLSLQSTRPVQARPLSDGRVLLLEFGRRLLMADRDLSATTPVLDATNPQPVAFPSAGGHLLAAKADTTYVLDVAAQAYRVVAPSGKVVRRIFADPRFLRPLGSITAAPAFDTQGRIVYVDQFPPGRPVPGVQPQPDFFTIARIDLAGSRRDSLGVVKPNSTSPRQIVIDGKPAVTLTIPIVDVGDAWAMTSDGTLAMIRGSDFHVEWVGADGTRATTPPIAWPWHRYTAHELDSLRAAANAVQTRAVRSSSGSASAPPFEVKTEVSSEIPEREPAFVPASAMGDLDGRVWIRLGARSRGVVPGPSVYGIIDRSGVLVDRVRFPAQRTLAGFAPGGIVYAIATSPQGATLERYRYRP